MSENGYFGGNCGRCGRLIRYGGRQRTGEPEQSSSSVNRKISLKVKTPQCGVGQPHEEGSKIR